MAQARFYSSVAAKTTLTGTITASATTLTVASATGFPASLPYTLILERDTANEEVVTVTAVSSLTLTVTRSQDGTTGVAHSTGAVVEHGVSARDFSEPQAHIGASSAVHGITGSVVGTTDAQTLTNKTLTTPTIADHTNATHTHANAAGGGALVQANTHGSADTDTATTALHHTIGVGGNQAAAGNHAHAGVYAASSHAHAEADVTSLVTDLAGKAAAAHSHAESDVTSLVADLAGKSSTSHNHTASGLAGITRAEQAITTDGTLGKVTITHGLGSTPSSVVAVNLSTGGGVNTGIQVGNFTSTTFDLYLINTTTGVTAKNTSTSVCWIAMT